MRLLTESVQCRKSNVIVLSAFSLHLFGKEEEKERGHPAPRQGRAPAPLFPNLSGVFALVIAIDQKEEKLLSDRIAELLFLILKSSSHWMVLKATKKKP